MSLRTSISSLSWAALLVVAGCGGAKQTSHVGTAIDVAQATPIAKLASEPATYKDQMVRIEGTVKAVCQGMGCWVEVQDNKGQSFMAKSLDESVLLPKDCAGRKIVVQGVVTALPAAAQAEASPADHVCPKPDYVVAMQGVELR